MTVNCLVLYIDLFYVNIVGGILYTKSLAKCCSASSISKKFFVYMPFTLRLRIHVFPLIIIDRKKDDSDAVTGVCYGVSSFSSRSKSM